MNRKASCSDLYRDTLPADVRKRYNEKTSVIQVDPYELPDAEFTIDHHKWPLLSYVDMLDFLIFKQSYYTREQLRNVKSLDAQELVQDGWVREIRHKEIHGNHLLRAKVLITYDCCFSLSFLLFQRPRFLTPHPRTHFTCLHLPLMCWAPLEHILSGFLYIYMC